MNAAATKEQIERHLSGQYEAWANLIYPHKRSEPPAAVRFEYNDGASVYGVDDDEIILHIPDGNERDFDNRVGKIITAPDKWRLSRIETELLHEMMHERQCKEHPIVTDAGRQLAKKRTLFGPGHDEVFFTAIEISAKYLSVTPEELLRNIA